MNAEQVVEKILSEANTEAEKILSAAKVKAAAEESKLNNTLESFRKDTQELVEKSAAEKRDRMLANARMGLQKELLASKCALLDEVFELAIKKIAGLDDKAYLSLMESKLIEAVETGNEEVVIGKNETRIDAGFVKQVNRQLGPGYKGNLQLSEERTDISGGFILRRGKVQTNISTEVLVGQIREEMEMQLAGELFE